MRILQTIHSYKPYLNHFEKKYDINAEEITFTDLRQLLLQDRFYASHILEPILQNSHDGFFTMWDYPLLQHKWAESKGWAERNVKKILAAQIEEFKPDTFYNCSPLFFSKKEIESIVPQSTRNVCWFAAPTNQQIDFSVYESRLTNYPPDVRANSEFRSDYFSPAHDPVADDFAHKTERDIDILFYGQYMHGHFNNRNALVEKLVEFKMTSQLKIEICLQYNKEYKYLYPYGRPAFLKRISPRKQTFPPSEITNNSTLPLYGLDLYEKISGSKIIFNAAVDFSGQYKVNMRNFEATGLGALLLSDKGMYPAGFEHGKTMATYSDFDEFVSLSQYYLENESERACIAQNGNDMVKRNYSKNKQWEDFKTIVSSL
ncbi:glycosyltransferase [Flavobacteriales bacterium]|nr:glycosyltransferase [Flavobacteriales bacterium]